MKRFLLIICALSFFAGCAARTQVDYPSAELIAYGKEFMEAGKYKKAVEQFESAVLNADNPEDAEEAQRLMGDSFYLNKKYLDAIAAYEVYYDLYYENDDAPEILYRLGVAYSKISLHPRADQAFTQQSVDYFVQLLTLFPDAYEELGAVAVHQAMVEKLAEHEYQVGRFYMRISQPESAALRFLYMMRTYPGSKREADGFAMLIENSLRILGRYDAAVEYFAELQERFPDNPRIPGLARSIERAGQALAAETEPNPETE